MSGRSEWQRINNEARKARASYDGLEFILKGIIDFNPEKLRGTLFEYACKTLEKEKMNPVKNSECIDYLMRLKMTDIIRKVYEVSRKIDSPLFLTYRSDEIGNLVKYEHDYTNNASFAWQVVELKNTNYEPLSFFAR